MTSPAPSAAPAEHGTPDIVYEPDVVEAIVPLIPIVLPLVGAVLIFMLAFIAVFMG